jgi:hypothetical protein
MRTILVLGQRWLRLLTAETTAWVPWAADWSYETPPHYVVQGQQFSS